MGRLLEKKITLGRDAEGKRIRKSVYARTKAELERKVFEARQEYLTSSPTIEEDIAFVTYARRWVAQTKGRMSISTKESYNRILGCHIIPQLTGLYFSEIALEDLQHIIDNSWDCPPTAKLIKNVILQIYKAAAEDGIAVPKIALSRLAVPEEHPLERRALTPEEERAIFKADLTDRERAFVFMLYYCGLRRGEALALRAHRIDFKTCTVKVVDNLVWDKNEPVIGRTKTRSSVRDVPLPAAAVGFFKEYCRDHDILFPMATDPTRYMTNSSWRVLWAQVRQKLAQIEPSAKELTAHYFRHNYATKLYYSNISLKMAAKLLGHVNTNMITQVYAHLDDQKEKTAEKLDAIFK